MPGIKPMPSRVTFEAIDAGTRMTAPASFVDVAQMERMLTMGMQEGMSQAISQIDALLAPVAGA